MNLKYFYITNLLLIFSTFFIFSADLESLIEERNALESRLQEQSEDKTLFKPYIPTTKFKDLVGSIPYEIEEIIDEVRDCLSSGKKIKTHKIILYGLPGGGKTALSKAIAGELQWNFYNIPAGSLLTKYQGSAHDNINQLFDSIKKLNKPVILFIDEIDGLANKDHADQQSELKRAVHALHMIDEIEENLICILATNKRESLPETLITRYGENQINIPLPDKIKTIKILEKFLSGYNVENEAIDTAQRNCENVNCRQLEMIARKAIRIALFFHKKSNTQDQLIIKKEHLVVAVYIIQNQSCLYGSVIKGILNYFLSGKMVNNIIDEEINSIVNNSRIINNLIGLDADKIKSIVLLFKNPNLKGVFQYNKASFLQAILSYKHKYLLKENSEDPLLSREDVYKKISYLFEQFNIKADSGMLAVVAADAEDSFSALEIEKMLVMSVDIGDSIPGVNSMFLALYRLLETKTKPYLVKESRSVTKSNVSWGSVNPSISGIPLGKNIAASASPGVSINLPNREIKNHNFNIIKTLIHDLSKAQIDSNYGDDFYTSRIEYCNVRTPSFLLISNVIKYNLYLNGMYMDESYSNIIDSEVMLAVIKWAKPSCSTIRDIISKICYFTSLDRSNVCSDKHISEALKTFKFNTELYKQLGSYNVDEESYSGFKGANKSNCIIS